MIGLLVGIICIIACGYHDSVKQEEIASKAEYLYGGGHPNVLRERELFSHFYTKRKRLDGTPIPWDYGRAEIWNEVDKQLRKEGYRLRPATFELCRCRFDSNGYVIK